MRYHYRGTLRSAALGAALLSTPFLCRAQTPLFSPIERPVSKGNADSFLENLRKSPGFKSVIAVSINRDALTGDGLELNLSPETKMIVRFNEIWNAGEGSRKKEMRVGTMEDFPQGGVTLFVRDAYIRGNVRGIGSDFYVIEYSGGSHYIIRYDASLIPPEF